MTDAFQVVVGAGTNILEYGAIGAMLIFSLAGNFAQWWFGRKDRKAYNQKVEKIRREHIDHLETHYSEVGK